MSEHSESKNSTIPAIIVALIIAALVTWGIGLMNDGDTVSSGIAGVLLLLFSLYVILGLGKD